MKKLNISYSLFKILTPILLGSVVGIVFKDYTSYIESLNRNIMVPKSLFPIAWSILYVLIGIWYYFYEKEDNFKNNIIYYILLFINFLFTPVLFYFENIVLALIIALTLLGGNLYLLISSIKKGKYGYILLPYLLWLSFAVILMLDLFINNSI